MNWKNEKGEPLRALGCLVPLPVYDALVAESKLAGLPSVSAYVGKLLTDLYREKR